MLYCEIVHRNVHRRVFHFTRDSKGLSKLSKGKNFTCPFEHFLTLKVILQNRSYYIFFSTGAFDPKSKKFNKNDIFAAIMGLLIYQSSCERTVVNGVRAFADLTDFVMKHQAFWKIDDLKRFAEIMNVRE